MENSAVSRVTDAGTLVEDGSFNAELQANFWGGVVGLGHRV
jgi:hypothetical protein